MDKNAIKKYAVWARNELIARVTQKAEQYEITEKKTTPKEADSINGRLLTDAEKNQRKALIEKIQADGFEQVMEEVAYTWFNRFTALRFMEVNNYLPSHTRVFTNEAGEFKPQILADAIQLDLEGLNMDKVFELKDANKTEELYKYLLIIQCNALSDVLPGMFQKIEHYTELLLPDYLLREGSVTEQMITLIPEEDWTDQVQIIGWLYQYYNSEPKDAVFAALKKNVKISKENIPAATQLFTPDWIVRYMVENSLGRLWLEGHPNDNLKSEWKYYLDEAEQEADVQKQVEALRKEYASLKPEEIRCIDPCMGSGHILCYMFDVLVRIYEDYGYTAREAVGNIVEKNLWGLDIDERAAQLSYFAVMMKARQYDRRFFTRGIQPHVYAIEESNGITSAPMHDMGIDLSQEEYGSAVKQTMRLVEEMHNAKEYGSLIQVTPADWNLLRKFAIPRGFSEGQMTLDIHGEIEAARRIQRLIEIGELLSQKYDVLVTNPPYMGSKGMSSNLQSYVQKKYNDAKTDLFAAFIERGFSFIKPNGFNTQVTMQVWMFLTAFDKFRDKLLSGNHIVNLLHMDNMVMGIAFGTSATIFRKGYFPKYKARYSYATIADLNNNDEPDEFPINNSRLTCATVEGFERIPRKAIAYWASQRSTEAYKKFNRLDSYADVKKGMSTADDARFLRLWHEIEAPKFQVFTSFDSAKWYILNKGGSFRRWYGNNEYVVNWQNNGSEMKNFKKAVIRNEQYYFRDFALTWTYVTNYKLNVRYVEKSTFAAVGPCIFSDKNKLLWILGALNTHVAQAFADNVGGETITYEVGEVASIPIAYDADKESEVLSIVQENIDLTREDWDSFETSWDFQSHPLVSLRQSMKEHALMNHEEQDVLIADIFEIWKQKCEERFIKLKNNEEELNRIFIGIYGLNDEMMARVDDKDISIHKADMKRDIRNLISYAVGCMFGRYSLDEPGLVFAGGEWDASKYTTYQPDKDAIIPICDDEYFDDDIVGRFVKFVEVAYGVETLEENLKFIADALGGKGTSREVIRSYFINDFYSDHLKVYQKRPIYWLFDSGKKNGFKCLVYMHRYQSDTIARIRTDYVHEQQSRYRTAIADIENRISGTSTSERVRLNKRLSTLQAQAEEIRQYEEKIHHLADQMISIDLDDGVKHNYEIFKDMLAKIK